MARGKAKFGNLTQFAAAVGKDEGYLRRLLRNNQWPDELLSRAPPWTRADADGLAAYIKARSAARRNPLAGIEDELKQARKRKIELETRILKRQYIKREDVQRRWVARVAAVRTGLLGLPRHVASELVNKTDADEIEAILTDRVRILLWQFAGDEEQHANHDGQHQTGEHAQRNDRAG